MIEKLKNIIKKFTFRQVLFSLVLTVVLLIVISVSLPTAIRQLFVPVNDSSGIEESAQNAVDDQTKLTLEGNASYSIMEAMPFRSDFFNVNYDHTTNLFNVIINPISDVTEDEIYAWFESFGDVPEEFVPQIVIVDHWSSGAPAQ
jgi:hypothetical protein